MSTVLVTGASGFIGGHLTQRLVRRGERVRCLVRQSSNVELIQPLGVELAYADLARPEQLLETVAGCDAVFHLAGMTAAPRQSDMLQVNGEGTRRLVEACAALPRPPVFVLVSSIAAAGPAERETPRVAADPPAPISGYGNSKRAGEVAAEAAADKMPITIVRPGIVFGPRDPETFPIFSTIRWGHFHPTVGWRTPLLSLIHVEDLVDVLVSARQRGLRLDAKAIRAGDRTQGYYFGCYRESPTYGQFGQLIGHAFGRRFTVPMPVPRSISWLAASAVERIGRLRGRVGTFNPDKIREASVPSWACVPEATERELEFRPTHTLLQRLEETIRWYRQEKWM